MLSFHNFRIAFSFQFHCRKEQNETEEDGVCVDVGFSVSREGGGGGGLADQ